MNANSDTTAAIDSLESLLKAKIKLQEAQSEAEPLLKVIGLLFEPEVLNDDQKKVLQNGLKSLRKLLEAHSAYSAAVEQAEPARAIVNQLLSSQPKGFSGNGSSASLPSDPVETKETVVEESPIPTPQAEEPEDAALEAEELEDDLPKTTKTSNSTKAASSKKN